MGLPRNSTLDTSSISTIDISDSTTIIMSSVNGDHANPRQGCPVTLNELTLNEAGVLLVVKVLVEALVVVVAMMTTMMMMMMIVPWQVWTTRRRSWRC